MVVPITLMIVVASIVAADLIREDAGLLAAVLMGVVVGNQRGIDISLSLFEFEETLVQLLIGVLSSPLPCRPTRCARCFLRRSSSSPQ